MAQLGVNTVVISAALQGILANPATDVQNVDIGELADKAFAVEREVRARLQAIEDGAVPRSNQ